MCSEGVVVPSYYVEAVQVGVGTCLEGMEIEKVFSESLAASEQLEDQRATPGFDTSGKNCRL